MSDSVVWNAYRLSPVCLQYVAGARGRGIAQRRKQDCEFGCYWLARKVLAQASGLT